VASRQEFSIRVAAAPTKHSIVVFDSRLPAIHSAISVEHVITPANCSAVMKFETGFGIEMAEAD